MRGYVRVCVHACVRARHLHVRNISHGPLYETKVYNNYYHYNKNIFHSRMSTLLEVYHTLDSAQQQKSYTVMECDNLMDSSMILNTDSLDSRSTTICQNKTY